MKHYRVISLQLWLPILVSLLFILLVLAMIFNTRQDLELAQINSSQQFIEYDLNSLSQEVEIEIEINHPAEVARALSIRGLNKEYELLVLLDENQDVQYSTNNIWLNQTAKNIPLFDLKRFKKAQNKYQIDMALSDDKRTITAYFPVVLKRQKDELRQSHIGTLYLIYDLSYAMDTIWYGVWQSIRFILLVIVLSIISLFFFLRYFVSKPLQHIVDTTEQLANGELGIENKLFGNGELAKLGESFNDMSHQLEKNNERLIESEQFLKESQSIGSVGSWKLDLINNNLIWSDEVFKIFGLDPLKADMSYETFLNAVHPDDRDSVNAAYTSSIDKGRDSYEIDHRIIRQDDGEIRFVHEKCRHIKDTTGNIIISIGMTQDITERNKIEASIKYTNYILLSVLNTIPVRVFWKDTQSIYLGCNIHAAKDAGLDSPEEIIGKDDFQLAWSEQAELYREDDREVMLSGKAKLNYEEIQEHHDGSQHWLKTSKIPLKDERGNVYGVLGTYEDITHNKQLENQLVQSQKMEAVGQLSGGIAHDFNNILTSVLGYAYMMEETLLNQNDDTIKRYLNQVIKGGVRAQKLVEDMLLFSRKGLDTAEVVSVNTVLQDTIRLMKGSLPSSINIITNVDKENLFILIDPIQLEQIIMNLSINARDAMHEVGELMIDVQRLSIVESQKKFSNYLNGSKCERIDMCFCKDIYTDNHAGEYVEISVKDTGGGISKEMLTHVFEPFYTNKEVGKGTGMGLAIVHGIMQNVNGHIILETEENNGTVFRLLFNLYSKIETDKVANTMENITSVKHDDASILLVDDELSVLDFMGDVLSNKGHTVTKCVNGEEALTIFRESSEKFDLVITDQTMPRITGSKLSKHLFEINPDIPIIICTGYSEKINETQAKAIGIQAYLNKPITPDQLLKAVDNSLSINA
jgi:PAS domain S-box-containing protein